MNKSFEKDAIVRAMPVAEGVQFEVGDNTAYAVRNCKKDITVHVFPRTHRVRNFLSHIPLLRGIVRLFCALLSLFTGLSEAADLKPRRAIHGSAFSRKFSNLFQTHPETIAAMRNALAILLILLAMMLGLPWCVEYVLLLIPGLPRIAINMVCCLFRVLGSVLSVYMICRLKVISRLCMYRGAASKVINAYEAYGSGLTHESALLSPRLTERSDGAFLIIVMMLSIAGFACFRTDFLAVQLLYRIAVILIVAAISNELILPLENAHPNSSLAAIRQPLMELQHLFTIEPHNQMIEVALCAFQAACKKNRRKKRRSN